MCYSQSLIDEHTLKHGARKYSCEKCENIFDSSMQVEIHAREHLSKWKHFLTKETKLC